jgi:hypothetical protein
MITIVQNFICNINERLNIVKQNTPELGKSFCNYEFIVNFNDTVNFDVIKDVYTENIPKLQLYNNLEKDWALLTRSLLEQVTTPYVLYLCEDQVINATSIDIENILKEIKQLDITFVNMTKIKKYSKPSFYGYNEEKYGYSYMGAMSPTGRLSSDCIVKVDFWKERLEEFIQNKHKCPHIIPFPYEHLPNYFEGYYDHTLGIRRFRGMKCYIPKKIIFEEYTEIPQKK